MWATVLSPNICLGSMSPGTDGMCQEIGRKETKYINHFFFMVLEIKGIESIFFIYTTNVAPSLSLNPRIPHRIPFSFTSNRI